jgi:hypothetical protein
VSALWDKGSVTIGMRAVGALIAILLSVGVAWILIPPFSTPSALVGKPYAMLALQLGPSTGEIPDKFVVWEKSRGVAVWSIQARYDTWPIESRSVVRGAKRCLWIKWAAVSMLCTSASD